MIPALAALAVIAGWGCLCLVAIALLDLAARASHLDSPPDQEGQSIHE